MKRSTTSLPMRSSFQVSNIFWEGRFPDPYWVEDRLLAPLGLVSFLVHQAVPVTSRSAPKPGTSRCLSGQLSRAKESIAGTDSRGSRNYFSEPWSGAPAKHLRELDHHHIMFPEPYRKFCTAKEVVIQAYVQRLARLCQDDCTNDALLNQVQVIRMVPQVTVQKELTS